MFTRDPLANAEASIRRVYAYVAYRIGDGAEAEDVTSETFERALRYRSSYDSSKGSSIAWLLGIARRCTDDALAGRRPDGGEPEDVQAGGDLADDTLTRLDLREAMRGLDERDRELLALRYGADLKARQIAELLGERTNTIEVALHRALGRLRKLMEEEGPAPQERPDEERPVRVQRSPRVDPEPPL
jgi:RNA polymerase sigma-70 factor (ECF subfamily)